MMYLTQSPSDSVDAFYLFIVCQHEARHDDGHRAQQQGGQLPRHQENLVHGQTHPQPGHDRDCSQERQRAHVSGNQSRNPNGCQAGRGAVGYQNADQGHNGHRVNSLVC